MAQLTQSTTYTRMFLMVDSTDHLTGKTGLTVTVTLSKAGGSFGAAGGTVTEVASGMYKIALTTTDTNTLGDLAFHCTATGADPTDFIDQVVGAASSGLDAAGVRAAIGLASANLDTQLTAIDDYIDTEVAAIKTRVELALPAVAPAASGGLPTVDSTNSVKIQGGVKKNTALNAYEVVMVDFSGVPRTGLTVTAQRSIDGGAFGACTNAVSELSNGVYKIDLSAGDLNGSVVTLRFSATGAQDRLVTMVTVL